MLGNFKIRTLEQGDIPKVTSWSRLEGFAPGIGDVDIYQHTDNQGLWIGLLDDKPIGCIAGVRYNQFYGFIGLFLVVKEARGRGYGLRLWKHAMKHLNDIPCIGLEAAPERVEDYSNWGFVTSSTTTRWMWENDGIDILENIKQYSVNDIQGLKIIEGNQIPSHVVQAYDANREPSPRPHFLSDWLHHPSGKVLALVDNYGSCHGFGRIRPCLLSDGEGWRIGPLLADSPELANLLLCLLLERHPGVVLFDSPGLNPLAFDVLNKIGFKKLSQTVRMYRGDQPPISMKDVYGLACLELG